MIFVEFFGCESHLHGCVDGLDPTYFSKPGYDTSARGNRRQYLAIAVLDVVQHHPLKFLNPGTIDELKLGAVMRNGSSIIVEYHF